MKISLGWLSIHILRHMYILSKISMKCLGYTFELYLSLSCLQLNECEINSSLIWRWLFVNMHFLYNVSRSRNKIVERYLLPKNEWDAFRSCCWFCIHFGIKWELWKTFDTKMIRWSHFTTYTLLTRHVTKKSIATKLLKNRV